MSPDGSELQQTNPPKIRRACYVKVKLQGTTMVDTIKHKVLYIKSLSELLKLNQGDVYCRSCALEYCWGADLDNRILKVTKEHQQDLMDEEECMIHSLKLEQQQGGRHSMTSRKCKTVTNG